MASTKVRVKIQPHMGFLVSKLDAPKVVERTNAFSSQVGCDQWGKNLFVSSDRNSPCCVGKPGTRPRWFQRHATMQGIADSNTGLLKALVQSRMFQRLWPMINWFIKPDLIKVNVNFVSGPMSRDIQKGFREAAWSGIYHCSVWLTSVVRMMFI